MKKLIAAAALSVVALTAFVGAASADDDKVKTEIANGKTVAVVTSNATESDLYKARWAFYNADAREVKRFRVKGFSESDFKAIANIALRTGLSTDYIARQVQEVGLPLSFVAAWNGVPTTALSADIPGFNSQALALETK